MCLCLYCKVVSAVLYLRVLIGHLPQSIKLYHGNALSGDRIVHHTNSDSFNRITQLL